MVLRKLGQGDCPQPKAWRPIVFLNTIGKVIEGVTARYLLELPEHTGLLPMTQVEARRGRSTETTLDWMLSQIRTTWEAGEVATLLSMDISQAFPSMVP